MDFVCTCHIAVRRPHEREDATVEPPEWNLKLELTWKRGLPPLKLANLDI